MLEPDDLADFGYRPPQDDPTPAAAPWSPPELEPGSATSQAVLAAWRGDPAIIVKSPPGGGKSRLVVHLVAWLAGPAGLTVRVVTATNHQAASLTQRLADVLPPGVITWAPSLTSGFDPVSSQPDAVQAFGRNVTVSTAASLAITAFRRRGDVGADIVIFDEAYQITMAQFAAAAGNASQVVLVGDPGQIGPVVTVDTTAWASLPAGPHMRSPDALESARSLTPTVITMPDTWRFGRATVEAIAPLYSFPFGSRATLDRLTVDDGRALPEIAQFVVPVAATPDSPEIAAAITGLAGRLTGRPAVISGAARPLVASDVAVVVSRNTTATRVSSALRRDGLGAVTVGTADRLQGGQWPLVIALDPLTGSEEPGPHQTSPGRLCVMLSRHTGACVWAHDGRSLTTLAQAKIRDSNVTVRSRLEAAPYCP